jgi:glycerophosphoryl diester phosphodiesterase
MMRTILRAVSSTPRPPRHPFLDWPGPIAFAHRGGASEAPENTSPAFERAVELGYRYLETDVHVTADGVVVAFHDDDLSRTCGRPGLISELPWQEVATARVDGREPIPRLDELLSAWPDIRWNIDCKADRAADPLAAELARAKILDRVCVSAFSDRRLFRLRRRLGDGLCSGAGPAELAALRLFGWTLPGPLAAQVPVSRGRLTVVDERFVDRAHRRGIQVHVWTIDDADEMTRLLDLGVDGIMTDRPAVLRDVLLGRGAWS